MRNLVKADRSGVFSSRSAQPRAWAIRVAGSGAPSPNSPAWAGDPRALGRALASAGTRRRPRTHPGLPRVLRSPASRRPGPGAEPGRRDAARSPGRRARPGPRLTDFWVRVEPRPLAPARSLGGGPGCRWPAAWRSAPTERARYPPVAVGVLVHRAAPRVVHPARAPAAPAARHLEAQVRAGLGAGQAAQRVDPRVGASVDAHGDGHSGRGEARGARPAGARAVPGGRPAGPRGAAGALGAAAERELRRELRLGGRRGRRGAGARRGVGVGRRGRESPPRWQPAPGPHLAGSSPGEGGVRPARPSARPPRPPGDASRARCRDPGRDCERSPGVGPERRPGPGGLLWPPGGSRLEWKSRPLAHSLTKRVLWLIPGSDSDQRRNRRTRRAGWGWFGALKKCSNPGKCFRSLTSDI